MRPRAMYIATWLAATAIATAIGFVATTTVGDVIRGAGPIGAEYHPDPPQPDQAGAQPRVAEFTLNDVVVRAQCIGRSATLLDVVPGPGLSVLGTEQGPDEDVDVELLTPEGTELEIEIYCSAEGEPRPVVKDRPAQTTPGR